MVGVLEVEEFDRAVASRWQWIKDNRMVAGVLREKLPADSSNSWVLEW